MDDALADAVVAYIARSKCEGGECSERSELYARIGELNEKLRFG